MPHPIHRRFALSIFMILLMNGCHPVASPNTLSRAPHSSSIRHRATDHRPYILTNRNQPRPTWWLVDSGASQSIVSGNRAALSARGIKVGAPHHGNIHGMFQSQRGSIPSFRYQGASIPEIRGYVLKSDQFPQLRKMGGIIGVNTLTQNRAIMLLPEKRLVWHSRALKGIAGKRIKITRHPATGLLVLHSSINGHPAVLLVDTGASRSILSYRSARKFRLSMKQTPLSLHGIQKSQHSVYRVKKLTLKSSQGTPIHSGDFLVTDLSSIRKRLASEGNLQIDGILGYDLLSRNIRAIDFANGILIKLR